MTLPVKTREFCKVAHTDFKGIPKKLHFNITSVVPVQHTHQEILPRFPGWPCTYKCRSARSQHGLKPHVPFENLEQRKTCNHVQWRSHPCRYIVFSTKDKLVHLFLMSVAARRTITQTWKGNDVTLFAIVRIQKERSGETMNIWSIITELLAVPRISMKTNLFLVNSNHCLCSRTVHQSPRNDLVQLAQQ